MDEARAERAVLPCPSHEVDPYREIAPHLDVTSARARAMHALVAGAARVVVASAAALRPRVSAPERIRLAAVEIRSGAEFDPLLLLDRLVEAGFTREDPVDQHGEFGNRGGVVDVFPPGDLHPIRIEFLGDTVESIRRYDPGSQRSIETVDSASIVPLRDVLPGEEGETPDRSSSLLAYAAQARARLLVVEGDEVERHGRAHAESLQASHADAQSRGRLVPEPDALAVPWDTIASGLAPATRFEQLDLDEASDGAAGRQHVACQVAARYHGRLADWVADLRRARERGEAVLFVAATPGRAERTLELLRESTTSWRSPSMRRR
jgi:transcription-repair coupling factor (superfamily II helicase)